MNEPQAPNKNTIEFEGGVLGPDAVQRAAEVVARVAADGLETVRLSFADQHGVLRGKTVVAGALKSALREGLRAPSTTLLKDPSQRTVFPVWTGDAGFGPGELTGAGDVLLIPDPHSFRTLPWSPRSGWMLCDVTTTDRAPLAFASRTFLRSAIDRLADAGFEMIVGLEIEFHIFKLENPRLDHDDTGMPGAPPETSALTRSYELLGESRYDALEEVLDAIRHACEALHIPVRSIEPEFGPSQVEFVFEPGDPLGQADTMVLFRSMVKQICQRRGLHATFMCRPRVANAAASGWHIHQSLRDRRSGINVFMPDQDRVPSGTAGSWIAGLLDHAAESCLLTTPTVNGYRRFSQYQLAPDRIQWGVDNRGAMVRGLMRPGDKASRIENRVAEPAANPHYALASQIYSGLSGVEQELAAPAPVETPYDADAPSLPATMLAAIEAFENGGLYRKAAGADFVTYYSRLKHAEWDRYVSTLSEWEQREYFSLL